MSLSAQLHTPIADKMIFVKKGVAGLNTQYVQEDMLQVSYQVNVYC